MKRISMLAAGGLLMTAMLVGCQSRHESGVKSNYISQWAPVAANTQETTEAAKEVFEEQGLKDVMSNSTQVDGKASGKLADGTVVTAMVKKETDATSTVKVDVGTVGDPALGAELVKKIQRKAQD
jgi:Zn-dependent membrane protease YugP